MIPDELKNAMSYVTGRASEVLQARDLGVGCLENLFANKRLTEEVGKAVENNTIGYSDQSTGMALLSVAAHFVAEACDLLRPPETVVGLAGSTEELFELLSDDPAIPIELYGHKGKKIQVVKYNKTGMYELRPEPPAEKINVSFSSVV